MHPNLLSLPKRGTRSASQKKWCPLLQNTKLPVTDPIQKCQNTVTGHYLTRALDQLHTKPQRSCLLCPKEMCFQNFKKVTSEKWELRAKLNLSGDHLPKMDTDSIIAHIEAVLSHQICQDRKLLLPLTCTMQLLVCTSNTWVTCFPSHEKALPCSFRNLASRSCIPCSQH